MARSTPKNYLAAMRKHFQNRMGGGAPFPGTTQIADSDFDNNDAFTWSNAADTASVEGIRVDTDDLVRIGHSAQQPMWQPIKFNLATAGALRTQTIFIAKRPMAVRSIMEIHSTAESTAATCTLAIFKDTSTQAPGGGSTTMVGTFDAKATANTLQTATLLSVTADGMPANGLILAAGDRLSVVVSATPTELAGVTITMFATPGQKETSASYLVPTAAAQTTQAIFIANRDLEIASAAFVCSAISTDAGAVSLDVFKDTGTNAPGAGTSCLAAAINCKTVAANTVVTPALTATATVLRLAAGDRIAVKITGTPTALAGVAVMVFLRSVGSANFKSELSPTCALTTNALQVTQAFFIADRDYEIVDASLIASTAGSDGSATYTVAVAKGTTAPGSATTAITAVNVNTTANTTVAATLGTRRARWLAKGDRLVLLYAGTLTALVGGTATVSLQPR